MNIRRKPPNPKVRVENLEYAIPHKESEPQNILEEIVWHKDIEIDNFRKLVPMEELIKKTQNRTETKGFKKTLLNSTFKPGIIAEIKKASPSKGVIRKDFNPMEIAVLYENSGASCISVLTDKKFFQGGYEILSEVRKVTKLPIICKDFIISAYQIYKARLAGADAILLIAAILTDSDLAYLKKIADKLDIDVLVEVHDYDELERVLQLNCFELIGINNRDLKTFKTDLQNTFSLMNRFSNSFEKGNIHFISESGINNYQDLEMLKKHGIEGVLIGEMLMKEKDIQLGFKKLMKSY